MKVSEVIAMLRATPQEWDACFTGLSIHPPGERSVGQALRSKQALRALRYRSAHPDRVRSWSRAAYDAVYSRDGRKCRYCGAADRLTIDHVVPRIQGGDDTPENLVVACKSCNSRKRGRTPEQAGMELR